MSIVQDVSEAFKKRNSYNGNIKLKRGRAPMPYTEEQIIEIAKCKADIGYFIRNYIKIISLDEGLVNFKMYDYQEEMIETMKDNRFSIFLLSRQMGKSTSVAAYLCYEMTFNADKTIAVLANKADTSIEIMDRMQKMFEELPWFLKPGVKEWNKKNFELSNNSRAIAASTSSSSIRGKSINCLYLDEFAHVQNDVEFYTSTYPTITAGKTTKVIITSTPKGLNLFYKIWSDAEQGRNRFVHKQYLWYLHPDRDEAWKTETLNNMDQRQFDQEFECLFMGSSDTLISGQKLQQLQFIEPISSDEFRTVYELPIKDVPYVVTVDVGEGLGMDHTVISVFRIDATPYRLVMMWRSNIIPPMLVSGPAHDILKEYNDAYCIVESNSIGKLVAESLYYDYEYENMLFSKSKASDIQISSSSLIVGLRQTKKTKAIGCSVLKALVETDTLIVEDLRAIQELSTFVKKGTSFEAEPNKNDDIVMTMVIFAWLTNQTFFEDVTDINISNKLRENREQLEEQYHLVFGFHDNGIDDETTDMSLVRR